MTHVSEVLTVEVRPGIIGSKALKQERASQQKAPRP